jgi:hypothetical protein
MITKTRLKKTVGDIAEYHASIYDAYKQGPSCSCEWDQITGDIAKKCDQCVEHEKLVKQGQEIRKLFSKKLTKREYRKIYGWLQEAWSKTSYYDEVIKDEYGCDCTYDDEALVNECEDCEKIDNLHMVYTEATRELQSIIEKR